MRPLSKLERQREARERVAAQQMEAEREQVIARQTVELEAILAAHGGKLPTPPDDTQ